MQTTDITRAFKFKGLSTETKPDCNSKGSIFEETDTGDTFFYNGKRWVRVVEEESGGGAFFVKFTVTEVDDVLVCTADKTVAELQTAFSAGKYIYGVVYADGTGIVEPGVMRLASLEMSGESPSAWFNATYVTANFVNAYDIFMTSDGVEIESNFYDLSSLIVES